jgi:ribose/xylose/arabinose/galactoside ABC-type transport system permease subunit
MIEFDKHVNMMDVCHSGRIDLSRLHTFDGYSMFVKRCFDLTSGFDHCTALAALVVCGGLAGAFSAWLSRVFSSRKGRVAMGSLSNSLSFVP